jgi:hypothetical protein
MDVFTSFFNLLYSLRLRHEDEGKQCWVPSKRGMFDVRSFYIIRVTHEYTFPLEEYLTAYCSLEGDIFHLDNRPRENPNHG